MWQVSRPTSLLPEWTQDRRTSTEEVSSRLPRQVSEVLFTEIVEREYSKIFDARNESRSVCLSRSKIAMMVWYGRAGQESTLRMSRWQRLLTAFC